MPLDTIIDNLITQVQTVSEVDFVSKSSYSPVVENRLSVLFVPHGIEERISVDGQGVKNLTHRYTIPCEVWLRHNQDDLETNYSTMRNIGENIMHAILSGDGSSTYFVDTERELRYQILDGLVRADTNLIWFGADISIPILSFECLE